MLAYQNGLESRR